MENKTINTDGTMDWLLRHTENTSERYRDNEIFLIELLSMSFIKRLFCEKKLIRNHLKRMLNKYTV